MRVDLNAEQLHWLRYAILMVNAIEPDDSKREFYLGILDKMSEAEELESERANAEYYEDEGSRLPPMNEDDPNRPGVGDQFW